MLKASDLLTPKQVARAIGVSESSLKRWCDQGLIETIRTAGGHRRMAKRHVLKFVRERNQPLASPEVLGLPVVTPQAVSSLERASSQLVEALLKGDENSARRVVIELYLARYSLAVIFDEVMAAAFVEIGDRWACRQADVYQERRSCEICRNILYELHNLHAPPRPVHTAMGATIEGDQYTLPCAMAELVVSDAGFDAASLGTSIPVSSLIKAVNDARPAMFWLSVSHIREDLDFVAQFASLSKACSDQGVALVVGGRALSEDLRQKMVYSAFCDTMQHLESFARTLAGTRAPMPPPADD